MSVVHLMDRLMERQLDARAAAMLKQAVEASGIAVHLNAETVAIRGDNRAEAVALKDGREIRRRSGGGRRRHPPQCRTRRSRPVVDINRGIVVDDHLRTSKAGIYAIGECAEHRGICYGLVEPAYEQARVLADASCRRRCALSRQRARHQSQGVRRQRVLGRRFPGRARHRARSCSRMPGLPPTRSW